MPNTCKSNGPIFRNLRGKGKKVSGGRVSNTWAICPLDWDNTGKPVLIPDEIFWWHHRKMKGGLSKKLPLKDEPAAH